MKAKTAFESGNSPPKISESGAPIQTGRGLESVRERVRAAFNERKASRTTQEVGQSIRDPNPAHRWPLMASHSSEDGSLGGNGFCGSAARQYPASDR